jgi:hypothetical protein
MAALPPVPNCIQVTMIYGDGGDASIRNILYFTYSGSVSATDLGTFCALVKSEWGSNMAAQTVTTTALEEVFATDLGSHTGAQAADGNPSLAGTHAGPGLTSGAAFVMGNEGTLRYRGGHSRNYLPGMPQSGLQDPNTWTLTFQQAVLTAWTAFLQAVITHAPAAMGALAHAIAHRFGRTATSPVLSASAPDVPSVPLAAPFTEPVKANRTNPQVGSQRRRNLQVS